MSVLLKTAYVRFKRIDSNVSIPNNQNTYAAADGFAQQGIPVVPFTVQDDLDQAFDATLGSVPNGSTIVSGNIGDVHRVLRLAGRDVPPPLDYPECLKFALKRGIEKRTLGWVRQLVEEDGRVFVKPAAKIKHFTGVVWDPSNCVTRLSLAAYPDDTEVWVSEVVDGIRSEWRVFVKRGKIIGAKCYHGDSFYSPRGAFMNNCLNACNKSDEMPVAYALDIAVVERKRPNEPWKNILIEANDSYALGCYGLPSVVYARFLEARWAQLFGVESNA